MEYVIVTFPINRLVYIDKEKNGGTNQVLLVDTGTHVFDLGPVADYLPASQQVTVKDTTSLMPLTVEFHLKAAP